MNATEEVPSGGSGRGHWHYVFFSIALLGIIANLAILWRRKTTRKKTSTTTKTSLFLLKSMAAADTFCLLALLCMLSQRYFQIRNPFFLSMVCKLDLFVIHATSAFSIWCWLVLSAVRYVAVYRPYTHLRLSKEPRLAVAVLAGFCCVMETWVLYDIQFDPHSKACVSSSPESLSKKLQVAEIVVSYFLPVAIITVLDLKVLLSRAIWYRQSDALSLTSREAPEFNEDTPKTPKQSEVGTRFGSFESWSSRKTSSKMSNVGFSVGMLHTRTRKRAQQLKVFRRCLLITIFDLSMNLPNYLLRLYLTVISEEDYESLNMEVISSVETVSQVMYFAQFALNAVYLVCIIYDTPNRKEAKVLVSTQVSSACSPRSLPERKMFRFADSNSLMI